MTVLAVTSDVRRGVRNFTIESRSDNIDLCARNWPHTNDRRVLKKLISYVLHIITVTRGFFADRPSRAAERRWTSTMHTLWTLLNSKNMVEGHRIIFIYFNWMWRTERVIAGCFQGTRGCLRMESTSLEFASQQYSCGAYTETNALRLIFGFEVSQGRIWEGDCL